MHKWIMMMMMMMIMINSVCVHEWIRESVTEACLLQLHRKVLVDWTG
jgi:hypothetical protein